MQHFIRSNRKFDIFFQVANRNILKILFNKHSLKGFVYVAPIIPFALGGSR